MKIVSTSVSFLSEYYTRTDRLLSKKQEMWSSNSKLGEGNIVTVLYIIVIERDRAIRIHESMIR